MYGEDLIFLQSSGFGIHHVVFGDNVGGEGFHADKPASKPNQHQGGCREHGMIEVCQDKLNRPIGMSPDRVGPAEWEDRDEICKHHQQNECHDVVRNRSDHLAQHFDRVQWFVFRIVAGHGPENVAKYPRNNQRGDQQAEGVRQGLADHLGHRGREITERRAKIAPEQATPKREILLDRTARQPVQFCQSGAH